MEAIRSFLKKWGVTFAVTGTVIAVAFGFGQCSYDMSSRKVDVEVQVPEKSEDPGAPAEALDEASPADSANDSTGSVETESK